MKKIIFTIASLFIFTVLISSCTSQENQEENLYSGVFETSLGELIIDVPADESIADMETGETTQIIIYTCKDSDVTLSYLYKGDLEAPCIVQSFDNTPAKIKKVTLVSKTKI